MTDPARRLTSIHESGHVAAASYLGARDVTATLIPEGEFNGRTWASLPPREDALVALAGPLAVAKAERDADPTLEDLEDRYGGSGDLRRARLYATAAAKDTDPDEILSDLLQDSWTLLEIPTVAEAVRRIAAALDQFEKLDGFETRLCYDVAAEAAQQETERYWKEIAELWAQSVALVARRDQVGARLRELKRKREEG